MTDSVVIAQGGRDPALCVLRVGLSDFTLGKAQHTASSCEFH